MDSTALTFTILGLLLVLVWIVYYLRWHPRKRIERYDSGEVRKIYYVKGRKRCGTEHVYYRDGSLNRKKQYRNGTLNGRAVTYYPNGTPYIESNYEAGALVGEYRIFESDGRIKEVRNFSSVVV